MAALLRVVAVEGLLVPDGGRRLPGRGAHVHPDPHCVDLAERRRAFVRALRLPGPPDLTALRQAVTAADRPDPHPPAPAAPRPSRESRTPMSPR